MVPGIGKLLFAKIATVSQILVSQEIPYYTKFQDFQHQEIRQCIDRFPCSHGNVLSIREKNSLTRICQKGEKSLKFINQLRIRP